MNLLEAIKQEQLMYTDKLRICDKIYGVDYNGDV